ncbi:MAG TPA: hypothetical protein VHX16_03255, partial [Chloroflexota bacterium]|nr:hypothetical protein [Chloroflexota bacterium]
FTIGATPSSGSVLNILNWHTRPESPPQIRSTGVAAAVGFGRAVGATDAGLTPACGDCFSAGF